LIDQDFAGEGGNPEEADLFYELRNGLLKVAFPVFVDGQAIAKSGYLNQVHRRKELGDFIVRSPYLADALANRMWAHFLGFGFTKPVDDLGPHKPPSHPELLRYLSEQFRAEHYDLRQLMKWIVLSRPYSLSSKPNSSNRSDDPLLGEPPKFSRFYLRQMDAEQLYESLVVATQADRLAGSFEDRERTKNMWLQQFSRTFGTDEGDESTSFNGTIPQVLMMFNGDLIRQATSGSGASLIDAVVNDPKKSNREKVDYLFLAGLSRRATNDEWQLANQFVQARQGNAIEALKDLWWVILNSNEFIFNH
jgi:hypothetical protein